MSLRYPAAYLLALCLLAARVSPAVSEAHEGHARPPKAKSGSSEPVAVAQAAPATQQPAKGGPPKAKRWYKGNLHTHSLWSDGNDFPEMIADWYKSHGYHFLALSDHNILSKGEKWVRAEMPVRRGNAEALEKYRQRFGADWVETREQNGMLEVRLRGLDEFRGKLEVPGEFLMVQAEEISDRFESKPIHINASNLVELISPQGGNSIRETIANNLIAVELQSRQHGRPILAHVNHPNFGYALTAEDLAAVIEEKFFEIFNGHPSVNQLGNETHANLEQIWDIANTIRLAEMRQPPLYGLGTDDSHNYEGKGGASPGRGWVMVHAEELTPESLIAAMRAGDFYASTGVTLESVHFDAATKELSLNIKAEDGVEYVTQFVGTPKDYDRTNSPVLDKNGKEIVATRRYSADVGQVFSEVRGTKPTYKLTGRELYVRAIVQSSKPHPNPTIENQKEQAWTQPVGWDGQ